MNSERTIERLRKLAADAPSECLEFSTCDENPRIPIVRFKIAPRNPQAAVIHGFVADSQGIDFTIGKATGGEIPEGREERFFRICRAVFTSTFSEKLVYSRRGVVLRSEIELIIEGKRTKVGGHQVFWWLFPHKTNETINYSPYF